MGLPVYNALTYSDLLRTFSLYNGYSRHRVRHSHKRRASMREYKHCVCTSRTVNKYQLFRWRPFRREDVILQTGLTR